MGADGKSKTAPTIYTPSGTGQDPTGTSQLPADCAIAISTQTATRGPKGRGRVFWGGPIVTALNNDGTITLATKQALADNTKTMFNAWRAIGSVGSTLHYSPIIWHRPGDVGGLEDGTFGSAVRGVRVDDHMDTQRRRDRQVTPNWYTVTL